MLRRLDSDGYLFLPGFEERSEVLAAREDLVDRLVSLGVVRREGTRVLAAAGSEGGLFPEVAAASGPLMRLLYSGRRIELFESLFQESVRHYDFTWLRAVFRGHGTPTHMDSVFMNRGTHRLLTAWTPLGDIDRNLGGVTILAGSHQLDDVREGYAELDVDTYCENKPGADSLATQEQMVWNGMLSEEAIARCEGRGLQWLTADYSAGDLLVFPMFTVHGGRENQTDEVRLSCDSRYQRASEPVDGRWVGANPSAHGSRSKVGRIC